MDYGLYLTDTKPSPTLGGFVQVVSPTSVNKFGTLIYSPFADRAELYGFGTDLILGAYDNAYGFHVLATMHSGGAAATCMIDLNRAGNITMRDDKFIQLSDDVTGLVCNAANRGKIRHVKAGAGVKDQVEVCAKDAGDAYAWRVIY